MKKIFISSLLLASSLAYATDITKFISDKNCDQVVSNDVFQACYNYNLKGSTAVSYSVDGDKLSGDYVKIKKRPPFYSEKSIPVKYRSEPEDYTRSGYDRGHLANHADFDYSANLIYQTYSMANIVPQNPELNRHEWVKAEKYERNTAKTLGYVNVINLVYYNNNPTRIGKNKVAVPTEFVKVIYNDDKGFKKCFLYSNDTSINYENDNIRSHQYDCSKFGI